jgi:hypothetical protein
MIGERLAEVERKMDRLKKACMAGVIELEQFGVDNTPLEDEKLVLVTKLAAVDGHVPTVDFHPGAVVSFKTALSDLPALLCEDGERASAQLIRSFITRIPVTPAEERPRSPFQQRRMKVEISGGLDALLKDVLVRSSKTPQPRGHGSGGGIHQPHLSSC